MSKNADSPWVVIKFGGTSVADLSSWEGIAGIVRRRQKEGFRVLVVCSAVAGVTGELENIVSASVENRHADILARIAARHATLAKELGVSPSEIETHLAELNALCTGLSLVGEAGPRLRARMLSCGELMSTKLGAAYLARSGIEALWQDARELLVSTPARGAGEARRYLAGAVDDCRDEELARLFRKRPEGVIVTQGFIARDPEGHTVLLGRGGSDVSAALMAAKIGAARCEIWTDVPGMYTANPRELPEARLLTTLCYDEAQEIASSGAKVLHPRAIAPARRHAIPLWIRSTAHPDEAGTDIKPEAEADESIKAIASRRGIILVSMDTIEMWQQVGFLSDVFASFKKHNLSIDLVSTSESNVTVTLDRATNLFDSKLREALALDLGRFCNVHIVDNCALVSLVGRRVHAIWPQLGPALEAFDERRVYLVSQAANDLNLTFVVDDEEAQKLVAELHAELFRTPARGKVLGQSFREFTSPNGAAPVEKWWQRRSAELVEIAGKSSPVYVYDAETIARRIDDLGRIKSVARWFYSMKANRNPEVLSQIERAGRDSSALPQNDTGGRDSSPSANNDTRVIGFECVSRGEMERVFELFPKIDPARVLFTPNFAARADYEEAFRRGAHVTVDNGYPIERWPEVFQKRDILLRIDPGEGKGHHKYVHTAGAKQKFGIWPSELPRLSEAIDACGARVVGLHAHVGSNIFTPDTWAKNAAFLAETAARFPNARILDLGGGLGVVERPGQAPLDIAAVEAALSKARGAFPHFELWMEPGRFLVAEAGVLLSTVNQVKRKGEYTYIGVDAGMNALIRPALYGAWHEIANLSRLGDPVSCTATVVGPICESGDVLGHERPMPETTDGDVVAIATAGAYGHVMSSTYNMRALVAEICLGRART